MPDPAVVFARAAEIVESGWTQGAFARDAKGIACQSNDRAAVCFCGTAALWRAMGDAGAPPLVPLHPYMTRLARLLPAPPHPDVGELARFLHWHETPGRTQAEVVDLFVRAAGLVLLEERRA